MISIEFTKKNRKLMAIILFDVLIISLLIIYFGLLRPHLDIKINGTYIKTPIDITEFNFIDNHGMPFSKKNLEGHWSMVFFGFTNCEMVCPTTMTELNKMYKSLQQDLPKNQWPHVVFISVDPDRDTVEKLNRFMNSFNSHFIGLRADMAKTRALEKQLHITVAKNNPISHSMDILLLNPAAQVQAYFPYPHQAGKIAADYKLILDTIKTDSQRP